MQETENAVIEEVQEPTEIVELEEEVKEDSPVESAPIEDVSVEAESESKDADELENYSQNVQKRISTLTKKMREQERAAESAYEYARNLQAENENLKQSSTQVNQNYQSAFSF